MKFQRGFKTYCERMASEVRSELGLELSQPMPFSDLAQVLCIPVFPLSELLTLSAAQRDCLHVQEIYRKVSAFTIFKGSVRTIVFNDQHALPRHRSNLAHEFAHALLGHPPLSDELSDATHLQHEQEAAWLGGVLMLTAEQAREVVLSGMRAEAAAAQYQLSQEMLRFRLNVSGATKLYRRALRA